MEFHYVDAILFIEKFITYLLIIHFLGVKIASSVIFLGTGGDSYVIGKQLRASGGIILQLDEDQYHIDPGPGSLVMARESGINLRANTALFVTHNHLNHANDINAVIDVPVKTVEQDLERELFCRTKQHN